MTLRDFRNLTARISLALPPIKALIQPQGKPTLLATTRTETA